MACYHPLKGFVIGKTVNNKDKLKITSYNVHHLEFSNKDNKYKEIYTDYPENPNKFILMPKFDIPCGHCLGCRLDYSRSWAARCVLEMKEHESSYFCTFTYDDLHLPIVSGTDPETGVIIQSGTLIKKDWQDFMKRLRKAYDLKYPGEKIRFFMAGEYGDKTFRPHYHAILFGLRLDDLRFYKRVGDYNYYNSPWLQELWPYGFVVVGEASFETAAYTARYITKKLNGQAAEKYKMMNIQPEFALMSRKPGIGAAYVDRNIDHLLDDEFIYVSTPDGGKKFPPPRYFKRKYDEWFESSDLTNFCQWKYDTVEASLRAMESIKQLQEDSTDLSYIDMLSVQEEAQKARMKSLERRL